MASLLNSGIRNITAHNSNTQREKTTTSQMEVKTREFKKEVIPDKVLKIVEDFKPIDEDENLFKKIQKNAKYKKRRNYMVID